MILLPIPKEISHREGTYDLSYDSRITLHTSCAREVFDYAYLLKETVVKEAGLPCTITRGGSASIVIKQEETLGLQQYHLTISKEGVELAGGSKEGVLWGIQTLRQIVRQSGAALPCLEIMDEPDMEVRGFYHDMTRGRIPKLAFLKEMVDLLSYYKINQFQLYMEHSFLFEGLSEVWRDDTPYTAEEILELDRYCITRGVELVPSLSTFGHLYKLLSTKQYRDGCELDDAGMEKFRFDDRMHHHTLNVYHDGVKEQIRRMIREYLPLFTSRKFNICADETFDLGKGKNKAFADEHGVGRLYIGYVKELCDLVKELGSTPMIWGDVLLGFPELSKELPEDTICLNWGYAADETETATETYADLKVRQYVCPGVAGWNQFVNLLHDSYENISRMSAYGMKYHCEGLLNTDWGDFGHINHPTNSIPGMIYGAAASWNRKAFPDYVELNQMISRLEYKDRSGEFLYFMGLLSEQESFGWYDAVMLKEVWTKNGAEGVKNELEQIRVRIETEREKCAAIHECVHGLKACTASMEAESRHAVYPYLVAADGIRIFNRIGKLLLRAFRESDWKHLKELFVKDKDLSLLPMGKGSAELRQIAEELECWYYEFCKLWRSCSREAELYRVGEVICWYADLLRAI